MTPVDHIDALLRAELRRSDEMVVENKYHAVLARSAQRTRRRRGVIGAGVVVAVLIGGASAVQVVRTPHAEVAVAPPVGLSGSWSRVIDGRTWTIEFASGAVLEVSAPDASRYGTDGAAYAQEGSTVRLDAFANAACDELVPGTYQWTVSRATVLDLQARTEPCAERQAVFEGRWTAQP